MSPGLGARDQVTCAVRGAAKCSYVPHGEYRVRSYGRKSNVYRLNAFAAIPKDVERARAANGEVPSSRNGWVLLACWTNADRSLLRGAGLLRVSCIQHSRNFACHGLAPSRPLVILLVAKGETGRVIIMRTAARASRTTATVVDDLKLRWQTVSIFAGTLALSARCVFPG